MSYETPTFFDTIIASPEWQAWVRQNELYPEWDVHESMASGFLSSKHFAAFQAFCAEQYQIRDELIRNS